jgi:hypothetical protein
LEETAAGLRAYWRTTGGVSERALLTQRRRPFSSVPSPSISQEQHRRLQLLKDDHHHVTTADDEELFDECEEEEEDECRRGGGDPVSLATADGDEEEDEELDEVEVQRRVARYAAERKQRLRAFAVFARKHTSCFI